MPTADGAGPGGPLVSVVIAVHDDAERLPVAVVSALDQSVTPIEVLICDDGSTDDTGQVARRLSDSDPRVRYLPLGRNTGSASAPRNLGLDAAVAPWVTFLDSDDELAPGALRSLIDVAVLTGADLVAGRVSRFHVAQRRWSGWRRRLFDDQRVIDSLEDEPGLLLDTLAVGKLYSVDHLRRSGLRFREGMLYEDVLWTAQTYACADRVALVPEHVYTWNVDHPTGRASVTTDRLSERNLRDRIRSALLVIDYFRARQQDGLARVAAVKFVRHDLALCMADLQGLDDAAGARLLEAFADAVALLDEQVLTGLSSLDRLGIWMVRRDDVAGARAVYRAIARGEFATDLIRDGGRTYWSGALRAAVPAGTAAVLDITDESLDRRPFLQRQFAHDLVAWDAASDGSLNLRVVTWDPLAVLSQGDVRLWLELASHRVGDDTRRVSGSDIGNRGVRIESTFRLSPGMLDTIRGAEAGAQVVVRVVVRMGALENVGPLPFPRPGGYIALPLPPVGGDTRWSGPRVAPDRTPEGFLALAPESSDGDTLGQGRIARGATSLHGTASRATDALRKRVRLRRHRPLVLLSAEGGLRFGGDARHIHDELRRSGWGGELVWVRGRGRQGFPDDVETVLRGSREYYLAAGSARYWVGDVGEDVHLRKPERTVYLAVQERSPSVCDRPQGGGRLDGHLVHGGDPNGRWDLLLRDGAPGIGRDRTARPIGRPHRDPLVNSIDEVDRSEALARLGVPSLGSGVDALVDPEGLSRSGWAGLPWPLDEELDDMARGVRLLLQPAPRDRWRIPGRDSHVLVDVSQAADRSVIMLASDVMVAGPGRGVCDYLLLGRPVIEFHAGATSGQTGGPVGFAAGPVARSRTELLGLLATVDDWAPEYADAAAELRSMLFPAEDGRAAARVVAAVF